MIMNNCKIFYRKWSFACFQAPSILFVHDLSSGVRVLVFLAERALMKYCKVPVTGSVEVAIRAPAITVYRRHFSHVPLY